MKALNNYLVVKEYEVKQGEFKIEMVDSTYLHANRWQTVLSIGPGHPDISNATPSVLHENQLIYCAAHGLVPIDDSQSFISEFDVMGYADESNPLETFQPLGNLIYIKKDEEKKRSELGLELLGSEVKRVSTGTVVKVGTGWVNFNNTPIPFHVKPGDRVYYDKDQTMRVSFADLGLDEEYVVISHNNIFGLL